jgi:polyhydroxyalkanoate synthase subunit PhaE
MQHDLWRQWQSLAAGAPASADAARLFSDFLREQFADFKLPWAAGFGAAPGAAAPSLMDAPALGPTREHQQRLQRMAQAFRRIEESQRQLQRLWSDSLREAATAFAQGSGAPPAAAISAEALRKLYDNWIDCAESAYARTAHGDEFCKALSEFVNASSEWRKELQASVEVWAKQLDLPTRSELNSLNSRLKTLEEQLRAARKAKAPGKPAPKRAAAAQGRATAQGGATAQGKAKPKRKATRERKARR